MSTPGLDEVMAFLTDRGYSRAASALLDDVRSRGGAATSAEPPSNLPPLRMSPPSHAASSSDNDDEAFVSMHSSPGTGLQNPYGMWSPVEARSETSSSDMEFGTAREYNNSSEFFNESSWWYDESLTRGPCKADESKDKFVTSTDSGTGNCEDGAESGTVYNCNSPLCDCCKGRGKKGNPSGAVYERYKIMDDSTEILYEFGLGEENGRDVVLEGDTLRDAGLKELEIVASYMADSAAFADLESELEVKINKNCESTNDVEIEHVPKGSHTELGTSSDNEDVDVAFEMGDFGPLNGDGDVKDLGRKNAEEVEEKETSVELALSNFMKEYEIFDLRIIHRKNKTGFEENKDFPIILNSVIAGRYYVTEYLGSAAFSKVIQAHDLQTGMDVCLKIIKNDKDFFDQSLDEIKLLKFVNKYDPSDEHHILRLYDYFYYQEHLFIVTELLRANLYEFQKYNQESGGEVYFSIPRIQAIARQCLEALVYLHKLRIMHCDLKPENILIKSYSRCEIKVIDLGSSCFVTDNLCLYVQSRSYRAPEVILGLPYDQRIDIWSLGCILAELYTGEVLFPNDSVAMMLARIIGIIAPIDMEMLVLGQETSKYFTDDYDLFHKNEETDQLEYLVPEKSSLQQHLQSSDTKFVDFISHLLQINPRRRPTAEEALQHQWLSFSYH
ncbi:Protein kinase superfamily protein [Rhynchospora pubera]|uniref:Protein kinase superfamily protein n=1 Tax=Rhynchospora pubera TaxID=906938 RepID=A0AAV8HQG7_9POAL|nr:Protein kinase superfamily protein [Rhynchospora pubera]